MLVGPVGCCLRRLLFAIAALLAGCGDSTSPSQSPTTLAIVPSDDLLTLKTALTYTVVGAFPDGSTRQVGAKWVTDNPGVATANAGGTVTRRWRGLWLTIPGS